MTRMEMPKHVANIDSEHYNRLREVIRAHRARTTKLRRELLDQFDALTPEEKLEYLMLMALDVQASAHELGNELLRHLREHRKAGK